MADVPLVGLTKKDRWFIRVTGAIVIGSIIALGLFTISANHQLRDTQLNSCASRNESAVEANGTWRPALRLLLAESSHPELAAKVKDAPILDCNTGKPVEGNG